MLRGAVEKKEVGLLVLQQRNSEADQNGMQLFKHCNGKFAPGSETLYRAETCLDPRETGVSMQILYEVAEQKESHAVGARIGNKLGISVVRKVGGGNGGRSLDDGGAGCYIALEAMDPRD